MITVVDITSEHMYISTLKSPQIYCNQCSRCAQDKKASKALQFQGLCRGRANYTAPPPPARNQVISKHWWKCKSPKLRPSGPYT